MARVNFVRGGEQQHVLAGNVRGLFGLRYEMNQLRSKVGNDASARTAPVFGSSTTMAPALAPADALLRTP